MCQSIVMAGGGVWGGQVYGKSDRIAAYPTENPVTPGDVGATICCVSACVPIPKSSIRQAGRIRSSTANRFRPFCSPFGAGSNADEMQ